jgi:hypothetical protein
MLFQAATIFDHDVDSTELRDGSLDYYLRVLGTSDVELDGQQVVVAAHRGRDLRSIAASGDNGVAGGQGGLGDVDAQASTSARDEPHFLFTHDMSLTWTTNPNVVWKSNVKNEPRAMAT